MIDRDLTMTESWRDREAREDAGRLDALRREKREACKALFFTLAVVIAPFLALVVFGLEVALVVLAGGLVLTIVLTLNAANQTAAIVRSRLRAAAAVNGLVLAMVLGILVLVLRT